MFTIFSKAKRRDCEGNTRRDFLKVGAVGSSLLTLPNLLRARAKAPVAVNNKSIIWIWVAGGFRCEDEVCKAVDAEDHALRPHLFRLPEHWARSASATRAGATPAAAAPVSTARARAERG